MEGAGLVDLARCRQGLGDDLQQLCIHRSTPGRQRGPDAHEATGPGWPGGISVGSAVGTGNFPTPALTGSGSEGRHAAPLQRPMASQPPALAAGSPRTYAFLVLSGLATGASWWCYFRALHIGDAARVAPLDKLSVILVALFGVGFLGEKLAPVNWLGIVMIAAGAWFVTLKP